MWFARARRKDTGEVVDLRDIAEMNSRPDGQIRIWLNEPYSDPAWVECDLEMYTGFVDKNKNYIYEGDSIILDGNIYVVMVNHFLGQWVIDGDTGQCALWEVAHKCILKKMQNQNGRKK